MARNHPHSPPSVTELLRRTGTLRTPRLKRLVPPLLNWFSKHARDLPWRRTRDPYAIWVSEIMLQQTQVKTVMPYWQRWMRELPTIKSVANASPDKIHKLWEGLGYYTRARNLQKAAQQIVAQHDVRSKVRRRRGNESQTEKKSETPSAFARLRRDKHVVSYKFPDKFGDVLALPGIGRYTAGAICSIAFNQPMPILDGNVIRVLTRIFGIGENPKEKKTNARLWDIAGELVCHASRFTHHETNSRTSRLRYTSPRQGTMDEDEDDLACSHLNQSLMELGALICTPRNPRCGICPVKKLCVALRENRIDELPNLGKHATATERHFVAFIVERNGEFLIRQRPAGVVNAHLWEFPNLEILNGDFNPQLALKNTLGIENSEIQSFHTIKHSITRYRITLETFRVHLGGTSSMSPQSKRTETGARGTRPSKTGVWLAPAQMRQLAFSSAHKKILAHLHSSHVSDATPETTRGTRGAS